MAINNNISGGSFYPTYGTSSGFNTYPYYMVDNTQAMLQAQQAQLAQQQQIIQQMQAAQMTPGNGNIGENLQELQEVRAELRRRKMQQTERKPLNQDVLMPFPANENRLFTPIVPVNRYVHPDQHIEWLMGRTRAVRSKLSWAKVA